MSEQNGDLLVDPWVGIAVAGALILLLALIVVFGRRGSSDDGKLDRMAERLKAAEDDLAKVQHDVSNVRHVVNNQPTNLDMQMVGSRMTSMELVLKANTHSLTRIEDFLFQTAGRALVDRYHGDPKSEAT